jgi:glycosyltransferase involved in cell wall biosynthesis
MTVNTSSILPLSLVVATLGRTTQVATLLRSLAAQDFTEFEVIIVDQNDDDRLLPFLAGDWPFPLRRVYTPSKRGASRARNAGWRESRGSIILFPDDDCWYPADFLRKGLETMDRLNAAVLSGRPADETGRTINGRFETKPMKMDRETVWTTAIEWIVFFRRNVLEAVEGFDDDIGIGAATPWQSSEIQDIVIRAIDARFGCWYNPDLVGHHEEMVVGRPDAHLIRKARGYARGMGFVLRQHGYSPSQRGLWILRPLVRGLVELVRGRGHMLPYYGQVALGRLEGALNRPFGS